MITIFHNPRCSNSRKALNLIREHDFEPEIIEYLKTPPSANKLADILKMLDIPAKNLLRTKEKNLIDSQTNIDKLSCQEIIQLIVNNPMLLQRPIVINNNKAVIARPPEELMRII